MKLWTMKLWARSSGSYGENDTFHGNFTFASSAFAVKLRWPVGAAFEGTFNGPHALAVIEATPEA
jgi:hypothetical protein